MAIVDAFSQLSPTVDVRQFYQGANVFNTLLQRLCECSKVY
jgi:hypothetical protein